MDNIILHHSYINAFLNWTKEHLDAYLAFANVSIDQYNEPD
jgi:hypothetical protein